MAESPSHSIRFSRIVKVPDPLRIARYRRSPELGPKILFFSGGSALKGLAQELPTYTHNSIHLITPFDSGGSSAKLRDAFGMLSIGDLRNRLMALADKSVTGFPAIVELFNTRLPKYTDNDSLIDYLNHLIEGKADLISAIPDPMRKIIRNHLGYFREAMPSEFDLKGASIGNLVLAGGYLNNGQHIDPVIFIFSKLAEVRGIVRPIVSSNNHLAVTLEDGTAIVGQNLLTGKEVPPISSPVVTIALSARQDFFQPVETELREKVASLIEEAELICYPIGSFFSSLIACLLPKGVGLAVAENSAPKIYIPNPKGDPEQIGMTIDKEIEWIERTLGADYDNIQNVLNLVLLDVDDKIYGRDLNIEKLRAMGIEILRTRLTTKESGNLFDGELLSQALISMV